MQRIVILFLIFLGCSNQVRELENSEKITVLVSVVPQQYFVEKIAGDMVDVKVLIPPGASPATYEISPSDMRQISEADIWFTIGLQRENTWITEFSALNEQLLIISTLGDIQRLPIDRYGIPGEDDLHDHGDMDPHVWLSPQLVSQQAQIICESLCDVDSSDSSIYSGNLDLFLHEIADLQIEIHHLIDPFAEEGFMVFHPAWGYFADEFNLIQVPIEISGSEPSPSELSRLIDYGRTASVKVVFVSPQFSESSAETIAEELDASVIFIDPLALNWSENLLYVAETIAGVLE